MARKPGSRARDYSSEPSKNRFGPKAVEPHSPWQLLVEEKRTEKEIALRELASRADIAAGTLFNWVRSKTGAPPRTSYTADLNRRLAAVLGVTADELADAYNASAFKPVDPNASEPSPRPAPHVSEDAATYTVDGLRRLLATLKSTGRTTFTLLELELSIAMLLGPDNAPEIVKPLDGNKPSGDSK
jgi:transcriptional regulator with XRE-family HTH domain